VANKDVVAACRFCSLMPNRRAQEVSNVRDSLRLAVIAIGLASIVASSSSIASTTSTKPNRIGEKLWDFFFLNFYGIIFGGIVGSDTTVTPRCYRSLPEREEKDNAAYRERPPEEPAACGEWPLEEPAACGERPPERSLPLVKSGHWRDRGRERGKRATRILFNSSIPCRQA
jgi:hypothetical protein